MEHIPAQVPGHLGGKHNSALWFKVKMQYQEKVTLVLCSSILFFGCCLGVFPSKELVFSQGIFRVACDTVGETVEMVVSEKKDA